MDYLDFFLRFDIGARGDLMLRLVDSLAGGAESLFVTPLVEQEVERTAKDLERSVQEKREQAPLRDISPDGFRSVSQRQREIGAQLFKALFPEPIRNRYHHVLGRLGPHAGHGLRLKLQMNLSDPKLVAVQSLPWEFLYRVEDETFLGLTRRTSIVRHLDLPLPGDMPRLPLPLRVLIVAPQPRGVNPLPHVQCEMLALQKLAGRRFEVVSLVTPTLEGLRHELLSQQFHVLHFLGHGAFGENGHEGVLYLEDGRGSVTRVSGTLLADHLRDITSLRLAVLNACQTARASAPGPFGGVATALLRTGLPAVIAMQFPISDQAASAFSIGFYHRLLGGDPLDAAVTEGRLKILRDLPHAAEWATPVLFLRAPDGHIFEPLHRPGKVRAIATLGVTCALTAGLLLTQDRSGKFPTPLSPSPQFRESPSLNKADETSSNTEDQSLESGDFSGQEASTAPSLAQNSLISPTQDNVETALEKQQQRQSLTTSTYLVHLLVSTSTKNPTIWLNGHRVEPVKRTANLITLEIPIADVIYQIRIEREGAPPCVTSISGNQEGSVLMPCQS